MGKLYFYYSAMNAGKTTTLLQSSFNYHERGMKTLLFTPIIDDRYGIGRITSRIGLESDAISFDRQFNFVDYCRPIASEYSCILVDEAQFLCRDQVWQLSCVVDECRIPVLAYGLRSDFRGTPFEGSTYLLAWADEIIEIKTICHCGKKATFNARIGPDGQMQQCGEQIVIGGNSLYISLCRKHFRQNQVTPDANKITAPTVNLTSPLDPNPPKQQFANSISDQGQCGHGGQSDNSNQSESAINESAVRGDDGDEEDVVNDEILNAYGDTSTDPSSSYSMQRCDSGIEIV